MPNSLTEAADGETAIDLVRSHLFDAAILDLGLPGLGGIETCIQIQKLCPDLPVLILTSHPDKQLVVKLIEVGAKGYCLKGIDAHKLVLAIRSISVGATWWDRNASNQICTIVGRDQSPFLERGSIDPVLLPADRSLLTKRELEVLALIAGGNSNQQIAEQLFISAGTVRVHVHAILQKLNVTDRTQAAIIALQHNFI
jgi:two-component system, NarL family, response regulator